jgi:DNA-binding NtrC family response regulator
MKERREILVVDDEASDLSLLCNTLRLEGYRVIPASGYVAAFNTFSFSLHSRPFDLLVTDIALPYKNGCELAETLLAMDPGLKVLLVSGLSGAEVLRFCKLHGQPEIPYLEKPIDRDKFVKMVSQILEPGVSVGSTSAY